MQNAAGVQVVHTRAQLDDAVEYPCLVERLPRVLGATDATIERTALGYRHQDAHVATIREGVVIPARATVGAAWSTRCLGASCHFLLDTPQIPRSMRLATPRSHHSHHAFLAPDGAPSSLSLFHLRARSTAGSMCICLVHSHSFPHAAT
eukprot:scaffold188472_cov27-Tisochrysis_lutea.AAC.1